MGKKPIVMAAQLCVIEPVCFDMLYNLLAEVNNGTDEYSTNSSASNALVEYDTHIESMIFAAHCWLTGIGGCLLNILTILVLAIGKHNSGEMRVQLINLALSDTLMSMVLPSVYYHHHFALGVDIAMCKYAGFAQYSTVTLSTLCNTAISIDRFIAVYYPLKVYHYTNMHKVLTAVVIWIVAISVDIGPLFNCDNFAIYDFAWCFCSPTRYKTSLGTANDQIIRVSKFAIPALVIVFLYILIGARISKWKQPGETCRNSSTTSRQEKEMKKKVCIGIFLVH